MKLLAIAAAALTLTACATGNDAYYKAIEARETRLAQQELRTDSAIAEMAAKGDAQAKGMGLMYFALKNAGPKQNQQASHCAPMVRRWRDTGCRQSAVLAAVCRPWLRWHSG